MAMFFQCYLSCLYNSQIVMYQPYQRKQSRERSRDRERRFTTRSPSQDDKAPQRKDQARNSKVRGKRVKFEGTDDIRVFRKQDEPTARGLAEEDILKIKTEIEKEIAKSYDFNWEHFKHRDAMLESNSMKEQKQRQKALSEKLMAARELISYSFPLRIAKLDLIIEFGSESQEREAHTSRIHDILGCYYTHISQIPNQPTFQILNTHPSPQSKAIKFDNDLFPDQPTTIRKTAETTRPLRSILRMPNERPAERSRSETRQIDPQLIYLLRDFKLNPQLYTKEKTEQLLKPYRDSGELDYLMRNKEVLETMLKNASSAPQAKPQSINMPGQYPKESAQRSGSQPTMLPHGHTFVPKADKFRTVPCKYYHSPQGCSKIDNCTFIHDERYPGVPVPANQSTPASSHPQPRPSTYGPPPPSIGYYPPTNSNPNYYNPSMGYTNQYPGYYATPTATYQAGFQMGRTNVQNPPSQTTPSQQPFGGQGYVNPAQGYGGQQGQQSQAYFAGQQGQYGSQGYTSTSGSGSSGQQYNNPNYQYYIGSNPPK